MTIEKTLEAILNELIAINTKLNVATGAVAVTQPATPAPPATPATSTPAPAPAPQPAEQKQLTLRDLLGAGMKAIAAGDIATVGAVLAQLKAIALPNEAVPQDARGLLGKTLIEIAKEDRDKAFAIIGQFVPNGMPVELKAVPEASYPQLAKALDNTLNPPSTAGLL